MSSRLPIFFIVATVAIDAMGIGLIMPVMPALLREVDGGGLGEAAIWGGILVGVTTFGFGCIGGFFTGLGEPAQASLGRGRARQGERLGGGHHRLQPAHIAKGRGAKKAGVFAAELRRALIPHPQGGAGGVQLMV